MQRGTNGQIDDKPASTQRELYKVPEQLVRSIARQLLGPPKNRLLTLMEEKETPQKMSTESMFSLIQARIEQLEAFESCEHQYLDRSEVPAILNAEETSQEGRILQLDPTWRHKGRKPPSLLVFELGVHQLNEGLNVGK